VSWLHFHSSVRTRRLDRSEPIVATLLPIEQLCQRIAWKDLNPAALRALVRRARDEDLAGRGLARPPVRSGDITTRSVVSSRASGRADVRARREIVACGVALVPLILEI